MRALRLLALRRLRLQPLRAVVTALTVGAGVSLAVALLIVIDSFEVSVRDAGRALAGPTELRVVGATSRGGLVDDVLPEIEATEGVAFAVPLVQSVTIAEDAAGAEVPVLAFGFDCRIASLLEGFPCDQALLDRSAAADAPPLVGAALATRLGDGAILRTNEGRLALEGAPAIAELDQLNEGRVVAMPMAQAQRRFSRPEAFDVVYVQPEPGADVTALTARLESAVGEVNGVLGSTDPPPSVGFVLLVFVPLLSILALLVLAIGAVLVHNTIALSMEERRRQLAIVAALGGSRRFLLGGTLAEAAALGLFGGAIGAAGGVLVAAPITSSLSGFTEKIAGIPLSVHVQGGAVVVALILGIGVAALSAIRPARRALRLDVAAELSGRGVVDEAAPATLHRRVIAFTALTLIGLGLCAVSEHDGALEPWQAVLAPVAFVLATIGSTMLVSAVAPLLIRLVGPRLGRRPASFRLAVANLAREPGRTGVMAVAIGLAAGVAFMTASYNESVRQSITENLLENLDGVEVSTLEPNNSANIDAKLPEAAVERLRELPGVASVERGAFVAVGHDGSDLVGVAAFEDPWLQQAVLDGSNDRARFDAGEVLIGPGLARSEGLRGGDTLRLDTPTGVAELPVLGVIQEGDFGGRNVLMAYPLLERLYGPQPAQFVTAKPEPGVSIDELVATIEGAGLDPDIEVRSPLELAAEIGDAVEENIAPFWALQRGLLVMAFIAVLSTLLLVGIQRQRELGLLAAVGMPPRELAAMVMAEAVVVVVAGVAVGLLSSMVIYAALLLVAPVILGFQNPFVLDVGAIGVYSTISLVVALAAAAWPAWRTARVEVLEALQYE